ncbi:hypothetical protein [Candidatus Xianfuyuplasma coldseepsis]|uniref:Uncharacterized protein n=1 Tax=Candidatus Xianfuyuplasma coldseepsis TaxID=2782163 RepID=A0A7L7KRP8_9MOLU|nr:hypothetical protein [Xianfuyuplasma coldseepsis]QMS84624.1 hypothetical protein G4Z02_02285 [Xianfuyuplasma coldseepsis]
MKSRKLGIALLAMLAIVVTTGTFAYWAGAVVAPTGGDTTTGTVTVGTGADVTTSFVLNNTVASGGQLVPSGQSGNSQGTPVEFVDLSYTVQWTEDGDQLLGTSTTANITATPSVAMVEDDGLTAITNQTILDLVVITPNVSNPSTITLDAAASTFAWTVTLTEPANSADYAVVQGATITITFTYSLDTIATTDN